LIMQALLNVEIILNMANKYLTQRVRKDVHLSKSEDDFDIEAGDDEESEMNQERRNSILNMPVGFENGLVFPNDVNKVENTEDDSQRDKVNEEQRVEDEDQQSTKKGDLENQIARGERIERKV
ncbi:hypothetical protein ILUMI_02140, partial [Ignelater luminosus]